MSKDKFLNIEIKQLIISKYKTIKDFASEYDFEYPSLISMLNSDLGNIKSKHLLKICKALDIDFEQLILSHEISPNPQQVFDYSNLDDSQNDNCDYANSHPELEHNSKHLTNDVLEIQKVFLSTQQSILSETIASHETLKTILQELRMLNNQ